MSPDRDPSSRAAREARLQECNEVLDLLHAGRGTNATFISTAVRIVSHLQARLAAARAARSEAKRLITLIEQIRPLEAAADTPLAFDRLLQQLIVRRSEIAAMPDLASVEANGDALDSQSG